MNHIFVLTAHKFGKIDTNNYVVGVQTSKSDAFDQAASHEAHRDGKYGVEVTKCSIGSGASDTIIVRECFDKTKGFVVDKYLI